MPTAKAKLGSAKAQLTQSLYHIRKAKNYVNKTLGKTGENEEAHRQLLLVKSMLLGVIGDLRGQYQVLEDIQDMIL